MFPLKRQGAYAFCLSPRLARIFCIFSYQCSGLRLRPYEVHLSNQYSSFFAPGSPIGGLMIVISSGGRTTWQKAFLQSPCFSVRRC